MACTGDVISDDTPPRVRLAIFGLGRIGSTHFLNTLQNRARADLLYVLDENVSLCHNAIAKYHLDSTEGLRADQADIVFNDKRVDAVLVCTPTITHGDIVKKALEHDKGVFCEKPLAESFEKIQECYQAAETSKRPLFCSFNRRFDPSARAFRDRIRSGEVGKIQLLKTTSRGHPSPSLDYLRSSGGVFHDAAIHDIDMVCWLTGDFPESVFVQGYTHDPDIAALNDIDTAVIVYKFKNGTMATTDLCRNATYGYDQRLEVLGSQGQLRTENHHVTSVLGYTRAGVQTDSYKYSLVERYADSYALALRHFVDIMQGLSSPEVTRREAENVFRIATACQQSCDQGCPIPITYD